MRLVNTAKNRLGDASPKLLLALGLIGMGATVVLACKATLKAKPVVEKRVEKINEIIATRDSEMVTTDVKEECQKELVKEYGKTGLDIIKIYSGPALIGVVSVASILGSHRILNNRYIGMATAYTALDNCYKIYRERVAEKYGATAEAEIFSGKKKEIVSVAEEDEEGKLVKVKKESISTDVASMLSPYAVFYSPDTTRNATKDAVYNKMQLEALIIEFNKELRAKGRVFLSEVYEALGFEPTKASRVMGWVWKPSCEEEELSDDYISFGLDKVFNTRFMEGLEHTAILDFNVVNIYAGLPDTIMDGVITC